VARHNLKARLYKIGVLSKYKQTPKEQILKEGGIIK
jgi:hypothetical protein